MDYLLYFAICLGATVIGAISGIGGGVIIKPAFDLCAGLPASTVSFLSGCTVLAMTTVSLLRSRSGTVRIEKRRGTLLGVGGAVGGIVGKRLFDIVLTAAANERLVGGIQNFVMALLSVGVFLYILNKKRIRTRNVSSSPLCLLIGFLLGLAGAFLGIGGGPINLVVLYYFFSMDTKTAALNSLYIIFFSQAASLLLLLCARTVPEFPAAVLGVMICGGVIGGFLGRSAGKRLSAAQTDRLFFVVLLAITLISAYNVARAIIPA